MNKRKLLGKALSGSKNLRFGEAVELAKAFGFRLSRTKGEAATFLLHPTVRELVNLQQVDGKAKPYQVRLLLEIVERYNLQIDESEEP